MKNSSDIIAIIKKKNNKFITLVEIMFTWITI